MAEIFSASCRVAVICPIPSRSASSTTTAGFTTDQAPSPNPIASISAWWSSTPLPQNQLQSFRQGPHLAVPLDCRCHSAGAYRSRQHLRVLKSERRPGRRPLCRIKDRWRAGYAVRGLQDAPFMAFWPFEFFFQSPANSSGQTHDGLPITVKDYFKIRSDAGLM